MFPRVPRASGFWGMETIMSILQLLSQHAAKPVAGQPSPYRDEFLREQARDGRLLLDSRGHLIAPAKGA